MITGAAQDGAIWCVPPLTAQCPRPANTSCWVPSGWRAYIIVFLERDMVDDAELLELVEMEVRELLEVRFPGDDTPSSTVA
jgi:elongation factor Tu